MIAIFVILGAILGGIFLQEGGIIPGGLLGFLLFRDFESRKKVNDLEHKVGLLRERERRSAKASATSPAETPVVKPVTDTPVEEAPAEDAPTTEAPPEVVLAVDPEPFDTIPQPTEEPALFENLPPVETDGSLFDSEPAVAAKGSTAPGEEKRERPTFANPSSTPVDVLIEDGFARIKEFLFGGNLLVRVGIGLIFIGLSFLLKKAIEYNLFPIELRLASAGLVGAAMIAAGWRIARNKRGYGVSLQGGGIAILYLTIFASFRLYELIPSQVAFFALIAITLLGSFIAIRQNAQSLAVLSFLGGFLAPIITSTDSGNHVALFSYYLVLNAGILFISWNKPWRFLHLTGFLFTFGIVTVWGNDAYAPELFGSTEPFLILFFLMYLAIGLIYTVRHESTTKRYLDGTLVFGLPVVVFTLQAALVEPYEFGLAWSSLAMGAIYSILAWMLYRRSPDKLRLLVESFTGIGLGLISMTIPFALDATWTGTGWALEGAALIWLGLRQRRVLLRAGGVLLLLGASLSFWYGVVEIEYAVRQTFRVILNPTYAGFLALSIASLFGAYQLHKHKDRLQFSLERLIGLILLVAGVGWWLFGGLIEIERGLESQFELNAMIAFLGLTALSFTLIGKRLNWTPLMKSALYLPIALFFAIPLSGLSSPHLFGEMGWLAWAIALTSLFTVLYLLEPVMSRLWGSWMHAISVWLTAIVFAAEGHWLFEQWAPEGSVWPDIGGFLAPLALVFLIVYMVKGSIWPAATRASAYLKIAAIPLLLSLLIGSIYLSFNAGGDPKPLPYIPVLNPIDVLLGFMALAGIYWYRTLLQTDAEFVVEPLRDTLKWGSLLMMFIWLNATIGRTVHHWLDIPFNEGLFEVSAFQTALSVCWTLLAVTVMAFAAKRNSRTPWMVAAGLLGVVVVKLFIVDLSNATTIHRVISFLGVGGLLLLIGYIAPVPPKKKVAV